MKASLAAVVFAAYLGAGPGAGTLARDDTVPAVESPRLGTVDCVAPGANAAPAAGAPALVDAYLRIHTDARGDVIIVGLPGPGMASGTAAAPADDCADVETFRAAGPAQIRSRLAGALK